MQRKLSAIAEIPKILTSTLQTVSQSFGSLQDVELSYMQRKCSYDEDALDYELATEDEHEHGDGDEAESEEAGQEDDLVQVPEDDDDEERLLQQCVAKQLKDLTPESDYASEVNYATNELNDEPDEELDTADEDVDEDENESALKTVYYMKLPAVSYSEHDGSDGHEAEERDGDDDDDDDDSDFLSTTYTWNLRNVPKLRVSDAESPQLETPANASDTSKVRPATPTPAPTPKPTCTPTPKDMLEATIASPTESQKLLFKLDNLERSWPWADREKIIYKQSTCHLVPRKPLGIVSQRVQLLAKQELQRKDKTQ
ncbi:hypothetical protein AWZ03_001782 [Drosophila navojoa]|uniref:Uncharacterized protein n=2 Tax=Drosophila navojoa TaxID=7232 RepID=A0A484BU26_DRONA|nr:hypothetical protein AWZ03_001782 [Drosophila navojoa]